MEFIKNCIICGNDNFSFFDELKALNSNEYFSLYKCNKCNLIFLNPRLSINKLVETENYTKLLSKKESDFNKNNLNEMIYSKKNIAKYKLIKKYYHNKHGRILDIGCSRGDFLKYMSLKNWLVCGTELSNDLTFVCDVKIIYGLNSLKKLISENQKFDVITLWAVLQHVYEPEILLKDCYKLLSENGLLFILVINSEAPNIK
ncbi:MAG TPA: class I SAM-dependent methyltransferase, partial [bacterium]|nr:class I SAM-dependent methyltransferase [bacterium]